MDNYDFLLKNGKACASTQFTRPVSVAHDFLSQKVSQLKPEGNTALGPGLLTAIALAGEGSLGSQVIVCTDGATNIGIGYRYGLNPEEPPSTFYAKCGEYAKSKGVTVHIVTIIGAQCNIDNITPVADVTNGEIERVNPKDLSSNFNEFLNKAVLATNVVLKVKLHKGLEFRNEVP